MTDKSEFAAALPFGGGYDTEKIKKKFFERVEKTDFCCIWKGTSNKGYGYMYLGNNKIQSTHRISYFIHTGKEASKFMHIDHLCKNTICCNPEHLEMVTPQENVRRSSRHIKQTHCQRGHEFDHKNTHFRKNGQRTCRLCREAGSKIRRAKYKIEIENGLRKKSIQKTKERTEKVKCHCGETFMAYKWDVARGWAKSCSLSCASKLRNKQTAIKKKAATITAARAYIKGDKP